MLMMTMKSGKMARWENKLRQKICYGNDYVCRLFIFIVFIICLKTTTTTTTTSASGTASTSEQPSTGIFKSTTTTKC
mgnify:CR=1 FL=1